MKKIIFILVCILWSFTFSVGTVAPVAVKSVDKTADTKETILKLIKEIDGNPASEANITKYDRITKFATESEEVQIFLIEDIYKFPSAKISESSRKIIQGSYMAGALRKQLETGQKVITISDGLANELKVYKILRETKFAKIEYLEKLLDVEKAGNIGQVYYDFDVMGMEIYQKSLGIPEDIEILTKVLDFPMYVDITGEKVLVMSMNFSMLGDLSTIIGFNVISNDYDKSQEILDKKAMEITKKLLKNETFKKVYNKNNYSGIMIEFVSPKNKISKEEVYKIMKNSDKDIELKEMVKQKIFEKEEIKKWGDTSGTSAATQNPEPKTPVNSEVKKNKKTKK